MFVLFEDAGKFLAGRVLSETDASAQVELESGKRVKVKAANVLLKFEKPQPQDLLRSAQEVASGIELDLAWEFAPEEEFGFADLAREYFSAQATLEQQAGTLLRLGQASCRKARISSRCASKSAKAWSLPSSSFIRTPG